MRYLTREDGIAAVWGGLIYGAGGGGLEDGLAIVESVFDLGRPSLIGLDELPDEALAVVSTGIGAPGGGGAPERFPEDFDRALILLRDRLVRGAAGHRGDTVGSIVGHPGARMVKTWVHSALDASQHVIDAATNGRGHPSARMGGLGLAGDTSHRLLFAGAGGSDDLRGRIEIVVESPLGPGSDLLRRAASLLGGGIAAVRGPFTAALLREASAVGAVSASIHLGRAILDAADRSPSGLISAAVDTIGGRIVAEGRVTANTVELGGGYTVGEIVVAAPGGPITVGVVNEFLTVDRGDERLATFPDLIVLFSAADGLAVAATDAADDVVIVTVPRGRILLGRGVLDRAAYPGVEELLGREIAAYL